MKPRLVAALVVWVAAALQPTPARAAPAPAAEAVASPSAPAPHPLHDPAYQLHLKRMRLGGGLIGGSVILVGAGTTLVVLGVKEGHPEPLCTTFDWTGPLLTCESYETEAQFDARQRKAWLLKGSGIVNLFAGAAMLGTGLGIYLVNRRGRERRLQELFGPLQGLRMSPATVGRGAQLSWTANF